MGKFWVGQFVDDDQRTALRTQLLRFEPTEILVHKKAVSAATQQLLHQECPQALITPIDPNSTFSAAALVALVQAGKSFRAEFECCVSALYLCVKYLQRCCVANLLMTERTFFFVDSIDEGV